MEWTVGEEREREREREREINIWATPHHTKNPNSSSHQNISPTYQLLVAGYPPSSNHSSSCSQLKSKPCISGEYIGLMFLAGPPGVAMV
jgi:hypothetical protein